MNAKGAKDKAEQSKALSTSKGPSVAQTSFRAAEIKAMNAGPTKLTAAQERKNGQVAAARYLKDNFDKGSKIDGNGGNGNGTLTRSEFNRVIDQQKKLGNTLMVKGLQDINSKNKDFSKNDLGKIATQIGSGKDATKLEVGKKRDTGGGGGFLSALTNNPVTRTVSSGAKALDKATGGLGSKAVSVGKDVVNATVVEPLKQTAKVATTAGKWAWEHKAEIGKGLAVGVAATGGFVVGGPVGAVAAGAGTAALINTGGQVIKNKGFKNFDVKSLAVDTVVGGVSGLAPGAGGFAVKTAGGVLGKTALKAGTKKVIETGIRGATEGAVFGAAPATGVVTKDALDGKLGKNTFKNAATTAAIGAGTGLVGGAALGAGASSIGKSITKLKTPASAVDAPTAPVKNPFNSTLEPKGIKSSTTSIEPTEEIAAAAKTSKLGKAGAALANASQTVQQTIAETGKKALDAASKLVEKGKDAVSKSPSKEPTSKATPDSTPRTKPVLGTVDPTKFTAAKAQQIEALQSHIDDGLELIRKGKTTDAVKHYQNQEVLKQAGYTPTDSEKIILNGQIPTNPKEIQIIADEVAKQSMHFNPEMGLKIKTAEPSFVDIGPQGIRPVVPKTQEEAAALQSLHHETALVHAEENIHALQHLLGRNITYTGQGTSLSPADEIDIATTLAANKVPLTETFLRRYNRNQFMSQE